MQQTTTITVDVALIVASVMPTVAIVGTAAISWFRAREEKRERAEVAAAATEKMQTTSAKLDGIHILVNDQLTREKASRLALLKSNRVLIAGIGGDGAEAVLADLAAQIHDLEAEIKQRDTTADSLVDSQKVSPKRKGS